MDDRVRTFDRYPISQWVPHKRETWPHHFAKLTEAVLFKQWHGHDANPEWTERFLPKGTPVKIVMVSRFGDVGITDDLDAITGYQARVTLESLEMLDTRP
jgi:hypothetical protein